MTDERPAVRYDELETRADADEYLPPSWQQKPGVSRGVLVWVIVALVGATIAVASLLALVRPVEARSLVTETAVSGQLSGTATWCAPTPRYCHGWGPPAMLGAMESFRYGDRPYWVRVCHGGRCVAVRVVSFCACGNTLIDISPAAFSQLAPLSRGRIPVTVTTIRGRTSTALPPTDTLEQP